MYQQDKDLQRYLVLVPHRDAARTIRMQLGQLYRSALIGPRLLPAVFFIARLSRPLKTFELSAAATELRSHTLAQGKDGSISLEGFSIEVPSIRIPKDALIEAYPYPFIPLETGLPGYSGDKKLSREYLHLSFRAAALANLVLRPNNSGGKGWEWKAGKAYWLPSPKNAKGAL